MSYSRSGEDCETCTILSQKRLLKFDNKSRFVNIIPAQDPTCWALRQLVHYIIMSIRSRNRTNFRTFQDIFRTPLNVLCGKFFFRRLLINAHKFANKLIPKPPSMFRLSVKWIQVNVTITKVDMEKCTVKVRICSIIWDIWNVILVSLYFSEFVDWHACHFLILLSFIKSLNLVSRVKYKYGTVDEVTFL